jgi:CubicO group peptidase (beta-lactamase class C family)
VDFDALITRTADGRDSVTARGKAQLVIEVKGDSAFGTWTFEEPGSQQRKLRGGQRHSEAKTKMPGLGISFNAPPATEPQMMPGTVPCVAIAALLATAPLTAQSRRSTAAEIVASVDSLAARIVSAQLTPGLGVAIAMDGRTILSKAYGWADVTNRVAANDRTLWYLASTSKSYTGFGVSLLAHQRAIDFATSIATLLPGVRWARGVKPNRLTLANFLSHTHYLNDIAVVQSASFTGAIPEPRWPDLIRFARPTGNTDLTYSNFGYNVAAMVIDRKRPEGWRRFLDSAVYKPAGMTETYARVSGLDTLRIAKPHSFHPVRGFVTRKFEKTDATMNSAGGHVATLHDLARWVIVQMDGGKIDGKQIFPAQAVALSHRLIARQTVEARKGFAYFDREGWGAGWDLGTYMGEPMVSRFGGYSTLRSHL